jgi:hypothetical protein
MPSLQTVFGIWRARAEVLFGKIRGDQFVADRSLRRPAVAKDVPHRADRPAPFSLALEEE